MTVLSKLSLPGPRLVILMRGVPGSGKSTVAAALVRWLEAAGLTVRVVSADRHMVGKKHNDENLREAHRLCRADFDEAVEGGVGVVIVDNTNIEPKHYAHYCNHDGNTIAVQMQVDAAVAAGRNVHGVPRGAVNRMSEMLRKDCTLLTHPCRPDCNEAELERFAASVLTREGRLAMSRRGQSHLEHSFLALIPDGGLSDIPCLGRESNVSDPHVTLCYGSGTPDDNELAALGLHLGCKVPMKITDFRDSESGTQAFGVEIAHEGVKGLVQEHRNPHITTYLPEGASAKDANELPPGEPLSPAVEMTGTLVRAYPYAFGAHLYLRGDPSLVEFVFLCDFDGTLKWAVGNKPLQHHNEVEFALGTRIKGPLYEEAVDLLSETEDSARDGRALRLVLTGRPNRLRDLIMWELGLDFDGYLGRPDGCSVPQEQFKMQALTVLLAVFPNAKFKIFEDNPAFLRCAQNLADVTGRDIELVDATCANVPDYINRKALEADRLYEAEIKCMAEELERGLSPRSRELRRILLELLKAKARMSTAKNPGSETDDANIRAVLESDLNPLRLLTVPELLHWIRQGLEGPEPLLTVCWEKTRHHFSVKYRGVPEYMLQFLFRGAVFGMSHKAQYTLLATPFPKFFGEEEQATKLYPRDKVISTLFVKDNEGTYRQAPNVRFEEKSDGSLGIGFWNADSRCWAVYTMKNPNSPQGMIAERMMAKRYGARISEVYRRGYTLLFEIVSAENPHVVNYGGESFLCLIGAYSPDGRQVSSEELDSIAELTGMRRPRMFCFDSPVELERALETLHGDEGFVVVVADVMRYKLKAGHYLELHKIMNLLSKHPLQTIMKHLLAGTFPTLLRLVQELQGNQSAVCKTIAAEIRRRMDLRIDEAVSILETARQKGMDIKKLGLARKEGSLVEQLGVEVPAWVDRVLNDAIKSDYADENPRDVVRALLGEDCEEGKDLGFKVLKLRKSMFGGVSEGVHVDVSSLSLADEEE